MELPMQLGDSCSGIFLTVACHVQNTATEQYMVAGILKDNILLDL